MPIDSLKITNVGPFDDIEFEFDRQVNVFTGPNNSGKSTALWVLGDILIPFHFPRKLLRGNAPATFEVHIGSHSDKELRGQLPIAQDNVYWDAERRGQHIGVLKMAGYTNFIPALRQSTDFRSPGPTVSANHRNIVPSGDKEDEHQRRQRLNLADAHVISDEAVIQKIIDLDYRSYRRREPAVRDIIVQIGEIASEITEGFPIQFLGVDEDDRGLFPQFGTPDGDIPLNVLSQGTQSIFQWLAHLLIGYSEYYEYPPDLAKHPGILIIDEIDAHLHPSWQRRIIPTLTDHFPNLQIFCSTHSPLMLAGLKEGQVQLLSRDEKGKVTVSRNDRDITGWSADEILRGFLDLREPTDLETVSHLERLRELRSKQSLSSLSEEGVAELEKLRHLVSRELMAGPRSAQVEEFAELMRKARGESTASGG
jgi:energy-coupling factor transporter ATP-binding protein EcfA2